jgi:Rrf2 family transcriptional regulator, cysteine metabolism repressor
MFYKFYVSYVNYIIHRFTVMKVSTRARYGLRLMIELTRAGAEKDPVDLRRISEITGLSDSYLSQLAIALRNRGLVRGVSGKGGGYMLAKSADEITVNEIIKSVIGKINLTECVSNPHSCLNADFCEARSIWALVNSAILDVFNKYTLEDLVSKDWLSEVKAAHPEMQLLNPGALILSENDDFMPGCPTSGKADE